MLTLSLVFWLAAAPDLMIQSKHWMQIDVMSFSDDARLLATGAGDKAVRVWDVPSGRLLFNVAVSDSPTLLVFSANKEHLVIGTGGGLYALDLQTGEMTPVARGSNVLALSRDERHFVTGTSDSVALWTIGKETPDAQYKVSDFPAFAVITPDHEEIVVALNGGEIVAIATNGGAQRQLAKHTTFMRDVAISTDGKWIATASDDNSSKLIELASGRTVIDAKAPTTVRGVAFDARAERFALAAGGMFSSEGVVHVYDTRTKQRLCVIEEPSVETVALSPDGKVAAVSGSNGRLALFDASTGKRLRTIDGFDKYAESVTRSADGNALVVTGQGDNVRIFDLVGSVVRGPTEVAKDHLFGAEISPDNKTLAVAEHSHLRLWKAQGSRFVETAHTDSDSFFARISPDGRRVAITVNGKLTIVDTQSGAVLKRFAFDALGAAWSPDGKHLAVGSEHVDIYDAKTFTLVSHVELGKDVGASVMAFRPDSKAIALHLSRDQIGLYDTSTGAKIATLQEGFPSWAGAMAFSADGKLFAVGHKSSAITIWDATTGKVLTTIAEYGKSVVFLNDNNTLATGVLGPGVRFWEARTGRKLLTVFLHGDTDWAAVTPDGHYDGTRGGLDLLHYVKDGAAVPLDSFFETLFTPRLVQQIIANKPIESRGVEANVTPPPEIVFVSPAAGAPASAEVDVTIEATDRGGGISEMRLYQNDKLVGGDTTDRGVQKKGKRRATYRIELSSGTNELRAVALNEARTESSPAVLRLERAAAAAASRLFVLLVGIDQYKNEKYRLSFGKKDATAFGEALEKKSRGMFKQIIVKRIYDATATRPAIEAAFAAIAKEAAPEDAFVLYYAGHGVMSEGSKTVAPEFFLAPTDVPKLYGDDEHLKEKAIAAGVLREWVTKIRAQKLLLVLDACQSGGAVEAFAFRGAAEEKAILQLARSAGIVVLAATGTEQFAAEVKTLGHGLFTFALLKGLAGAADGGNAPDGKITVKELEAYLNDEVPELTKKYRGGAQYPNSFARGQDFPLVVK